MPASNLSPSKLFSPALAALLILSSSHAGAVETSPKKMDRVTYQTISFYSEYHDHVVRWPNGKVNIYDKTGFTKWPTILERIQPFMPHVSLTMVDNENSANIVIEGVESLPMPFTHTCGVTQNYIAGDNSTISKSRVKIRRVDICIGDNKELGLYMHELGHALGFARHTKDNDVMGTYENHGKELHIKTLSAFLTGLYSLPVGALFKHEETFELVDKPTDWSAVTGQVLETLAPPSLDNLKKEVAVATNETREIVTVDLAKNIPADVLVKKLTEPARPPEAKIEEKVAMPVKNTAIENPVYIPVASQNPAKLRPITIIGPNGIQTQWVMTDADLAKPVQNAQPPVKETKKKTAK